MAVDVAISTNTRADYTVIITCAITRRNQLLVLEVYRARLNAPDLLRRLHTYHQRWRPSQIAIESTAYQASIVQHASRRGLPVKELRADKDKITRASYAADRMENGQIWFPDTASWLPDFLDELFTFPNDRHDDQVDALAYATTLLNTQRYQALQIPQLHRQEGSSPWLRNSQPTSLSIPPCPPNDS